MHEICGEAGMSPGALYRYFPSKESIIEAISEDHRREDRRSLSALTVAAFARTRGSPHSGECSYKKTAVVGEPTTAVGFLSDTDQTVRT